MLVSLALGPRLPHSNRFQGLSNQVKCSLANCLHVIHVCVGLLLLCLLLDPEGSQCSRWDGKLQEPTLFVLLHAHTHLFILASWNRTLKYLTALTFFCLPVCSPTNCRNFIQVCILLLLPVHVNCWVSVYFGKSVYRQPGFVLFSMTALHSLKKLPASKFA